MRVETSAVIDRPAEAVFDFVAAINGFARVLALPLLPMLPPLTRRMWKTLPNPGSVIALTPVQVWHIPGDAIRQLIRQDPDFAQLIIDMLSERLRHFVTLVEDLSLRPVTSRLARLILDEADGDTLQRPSWYTQNELAARLGTVTDVVQRSSRKLEADSLVEVGRQRILIIDGDKLEKLAA